MRSQFVLSEIWIGLRRNLTMTMALIVVVAISLSLLGTGLLFVKQVDRTRTYWQDKVELSIYLCIKTSPQPQCAQNGPSTAAQRQQIYQQLKSMPQVQTVYYVSQQQAYSEFRQDFSNERPSSRALRKATFPTRSRSSCIIPRPTTTSWPARSPARPGWRRWSTR